ncbi:MAG: DUF1501 domain-containing protein [Planctomycetaceae bacterium]
MSAPLWGNEPSRVVAGSGLSVPIDQPGFGKAKSVVVLFAGGGQSQLETWDPKPLAPLEVRGEFGSIPTRLPGVRFCEHLPLSAGVADRLSIVRSMSHESLDHGSAIYLSLTGRYHQQITGNPPALPTDFPCQGAILSRVRPSRDFVQTAVHLNGPLLAPREPSAGQYPGFLGEPFAPFVIGDVTTAAAAVPGLQLQEELPTLRIDARRRLLDQIEAGRATFLNQSRPEAASAYYDQAFALLDRPTTRDAFDLSQEPEQLRRKYGENRTGQSCLLARRLVKAGCPFVTVFLNHNIRGQDVAGDQIDEWGWDTHNDLYDGLKNYLLPRFDRAFSTFILDMESCGLLDETLVICMGEFGRAPLVAKEPRFAGASPGRKHWGACYSILFAGAGVVRGQTVGESDRDAAYPASQSYGPWDTMATIFHALGIDPASHYLSPAGQPFRITEGTPIRPLYR